MTKIIPQRANVTHRAEGASLLPATKTSYHRFIRSPFRRFSRRFAPLNDIKCVARNSIKSVRKFYYFLTNKLLFIPYEVLCHCEAPPIMGTPKDTLYFWGKGVCKHNTGDCRLRRLTGQKRSIRRVAISRKGILVIIPCKILSYLRGEKAQSAYYFVFIVY